MLKIPILASTGVIIAGLMLSGCVEAPKEVTLTESIESTQSTQGEEVEGVQTVEMNKEEPSVEYNELSDFEKSVILQKGTERAFVGEYTDLDAAGTYICRQCNAPLYKSDHKFHSDCGWPAFDDEIAGAVDRHPDADGFRVEIVCHNCEGHLGHVFTGERLTERNIRHCVNSVSMTFLPDGKELPTVIIKKNQE